MTILYLTEQGASLIKRGNRIVLIKGEKEISSYPIHLIERVNVYGRINISIPLLLHLAEREVDVSFFNGTGIYRASLGGKMPANVLLRVQQVRRYEDQQWRLRTSQQFIKAKIRQMKGCINSYRKNYSVPELENILATLSTTYDKIERTTSIQELMGWEGISSKAYFEAFGMMLRISHPFKGRTKRPPRDWVNSLLSLGYTLLASELSYLIEAASLDPYVGYLHELRYGRKSLVYDLCEEFRHSLIDPMILRIINLRIIGENDFVKEDESFRLKPELFRRFIEEYHRRLQKTAIKLGNGKLLTWKNLLEEQVHEMRESIEKNRLYRPFDEREDFKDRG